MESNRDEAFHCIELSKYYIKQKDLKKAWKFSVKANKLFPTSKTRRFMKKLKFFLKHLKRYSKRHSRQHSKQHSKKHNKTVSEDSDASYNGDNSGSSSDSNSSRSMHRSTQKTKPSFKSSTTYSFNMFEGINKDESYKCLEIAEKHIKIKQFDLAEKFVLKSKKLFLLPKADELLKEIQELKDINKTPTYTEEQANLVKKVKNSENYYVMLGVKNTGSVSEIKKAYKKLALLLHPDKNSAPGSGEVFTVVSNAVNTLCDNTKRFAYDKTLMKPSTSHRYSKNCFYQPSNHKPFGAQNSYKFYQNQFDESYDDEIYSDKEYDYCTEDEYNTIFDYYD